MNRHFELKPSGKLILRKKGLTNREIEVADNLVDSVGNEEIASRLGIETQSVKWHNTKIYKKMKVSGKYGFMLAMKEHIRGVN